MFPHSSVHHSCVLFGSCSQWLTCNKVGDIHGRWAPPQTGHQLIGVEHGDRKSKEIGENGSKDEGKHKGKLPAWELVLVKLCAKERVCCIF